MIYSINEITTDEYYKRKKERLEDQKKQDNERGSGYTSQYRRSNYANIAINNNTPSSHVKNDPKHKTAQKIEGRRRTPYGDLMPKSKTPSEKRLDSDRDKERKEIEYAKRVTDEKFLDGKKYNDSIMFDNNKYRIKDIQDAERAARRHYRRTHEAAGIFSSIEFV